MSENGGQDSLIAESPEGSKNLEWIARDSIYIFRLFSEVDDSLLSKLVVFRSSEARESFIDFVVLGGMACTVLSLAQLVIRRLAAIARLAQ